MATTEITVRPSGETSMVRQEFGATEIQIQRETAAAAVAAREQAAVQARYIVAAQRPRNIEQFRVRLEETCKRPGFAAKAEYAKPLGQKWNPNKGKMEDQFAYGPSIRFVEAALQLYGNAYPEITTVFDSPGFRICRVTVTDLEVNLSYTSEVQITKQVERKGKKQKDGSYNPPDGRTVISERINSYGEPTYTVIATDDEVLVKQNALLSKALRTNAQRLLPWDIVERCMQIARETRANEDAKDPDAAKRRMVDAFAAIGVEPVDLEAWLGHSLNKPLVAAEREKLLSIHTAIKDGETTWDEVMSARSETGSADLQDELLKRKLAEIEAEKQRQAQQQGSTTAAPTNEAGNPGTAEAPAPASTGKPKLQFGGNK